MTTHGSLFKIFVERDDQNAEFLSRPVRVYQAEYSAAIWDLAVYSSSNGQKHEVWLCEDSGKTVLLHFDQKLNIIASSL